MNTARSFASGSASAQDDDRVSAQDDGRYRALSLVPLTGSVEPIPSSFCAERSIAARTTKLLRRANLRLRSAPFRMPAWYLPLSAWSAGRGKPRRAGCGLSRFRTPAAGRRWAGICRRRRRLLSPLASDQKFVEVERLRAVAQSMIGARVDFYHEPVRASSDASQ